MAEIQRLEQPRGHDVPVCEEGERDEEGDDEGGHVLVPHDVVVVEAEISDLQHRLVVVDLQEMQMTVQMTGG